MPYLLLLISLALLCFNFCLNSCNHFLPRPKTTIDAVLRIQAKDPWLSQLTKITQQFNIIASGKLKGGNYLINGIPISVQDGTLFKLTLSVPIENPQSISTKDASGTLWTSIPLHSYGVLLPQEIVLKKGTVSGELDFVRILGSFLFNVLQEQLPSNAEGGDIKAMLLTSQIEKAQFALRPNSVYEKDGKIIHIGEKSEVEFRNLNIDKNFNYTGDCLVELNFLSSCRWIGKKVDCLFEGGRANIFLKVKRQNNILSLLLADNKSIIILHHSTYKFGKHKRSSAYCISSGIGLEKFLWLKEEFYPDAELHVFTRMNLKDTHLDVRTDHQETIAEFPGETPARIQIDIDRSGRQTQFETLQAVLAKKAVVQISRPTTKLNLDLDNANVGKIAFDKSGDLALSLGHGIAKLRHLEWSNGKKVLNLNSAGTSELAIPQGMSLFLSKDMGTKMTMPLLLRLGAATMTGSVGKVKLENLSGKVLIDIDKEVILSGNVDFHLIESGFLGSHKVIVRVRGAELKSKRKDVIVHLENCSAIIPNEDLQECIQSQIPTEKVLDLGKQILKRRHWRYKNARVEKVTFENIILQKLIVDGNNSAKFAVGGAVTVDGTIDKSSVLAIIKEPKHYQSKPWQIKANCIGQGTVKFNFIPNQSLSNSELDYKVRMDLPIPDDVSLDWSRVEDGIYHGLEKSIILSTLKNLDSVPLDYGGRMRLFDDKNPQLSSVALKNVLTKPAIHGVELDFSANAIF